MRTSAVAVGRELFGAADKLGLTVSDKTVVTGHPLPLVRLVVSDLRQLGAPVKAALASCDLGVDAVGGTRRRTAQLGKRQAKASRPADARSPPPPPPPPPLPLEPSAEGVQAPSSLPCWHGLVPVRSASQGGVCSEVLPAAFLLLTPETPQPSLPLLAQSTCV